MKKRHTSEEFFEDINGGLWSDGIVNRPTLLNADDFAFVPINAAIDTSGTEYMPVFLEGVWVWKPRGIKSLANQKGATYSSQILGWISETEPGDESEE